MSVEVANGIDEVDVECWTCTGRRDLCVEGCVVVAGGFVDILQARSCDDWRDAVLWRGGRRSVLRPLRSVRVDVCMPSLKQSCDEIKCMVMS
jgi:hypothetical protein